MTTASWSTPVDHSSDAGFRAWGSELSAKFAAVGMVQTADTGQINWTTVTRPGTSTSAGYEIWKLSGGALYFKIEYGTGSAAAIWSFWHTTGTGSNGTGTLTGQLSTRQQHGSYNGTNNSTVTNRQSYLCATADYFGLAWKIAYDTTVGRPAALLICCRTVDSTGTADTVGYFNFYLTTTQAAIYQCVATTAAVTGTAGGSQAPQTCSAILSNGASNPASSGDGSGNNQAFLWWHSILGTCPLKPLLHVAFILKNDLTLGNTASMTLVGTTAHTYICASGGGGTVLQDGLAAVTAANLGIIMLFE